jgi:PAS domain S-box-containing protein
MKNAKATLSKETVKENEEKDRRVIDFAPIGIGEITLTPPRFKWVNKATSKILGYTEEELLSMNPFDLIIEESRPLFHERLKKTLAGEEIEQSVDYKLKTKFGHGIWVNLNVKLIYTKSNAVGGLIFAQDITKRKKAEEALKKSEEKYWQLVEYAPSGIYQIDFNGPRFTGVNEAMCHYLGYTEQELLSINPFDLLDEQSKRLFQERIRKITADERVDETVEFHVRAKDGRELWAVLNVKLTYEDGKPQGAIVVAHDITERKRAKEALAATKDKLANELAALSKLHDISMRFVSQDKMQTLLDEIVKAAVIVTHADMGNMQLLSENNTLKIVSQFGFNKPFLDFFNRVDAETHSTCSAVLMTKKREIVEDITQSPIFADTSTLKVMREAGVKAVQSTPLFTRAGRFLGVISTHYRTSHKPSEGDLRLFDLLVRQAADFVERAQNEQKLQDYAENLEKLVEERTRQLKDSERMAAIGATAGMVGHDIRNPLQAIIGDLYLITNDLASMPESEEKESMKDSLMEIEKNVEYINKIVQDLQDYAKLLHPTAQETDFEELCKEVLVRSGVPDNIHVSIQVDEETKKLMADPDLLKRILSNLINNAIQAMPEGGKLGIQAFRDSADVVITVHDTGMGVPEENKSKLFKPLFTTKSKGQGFGLAVVKRMTEALGGTVAFESEEEKGTKFILRFPLKK